MARYAVLQNFYASKKWRLFRMCLIAEKLKETGTIRCEHCDKIVSNEKEIELHHIRELTHTNVNDYNISLNQENIRLLCHECHNKRHGRYGTLQKKVYLVYGCPASGKSTFVKQNQGRNDLIICIDRLYQAISGLGERDKPNALFTNIRTVYNQLLDQVKTRYGKWQTAWIIGGYADKYKREKIANELGAELIYIECDKEEAIARIKQDASIKNIEKEYIDYVNEWFDKYTV